MIKKLVCYFAVLILFVSCTNEEKFYGEWIVYSYGNYTDYAPFKIKIDKDSIYLFSTISNIYSSFPLQFNNKGMSFMGHDFKVDVESDTLLHFQDYVYKKKEVFSESEVKINLPDIKGFNFLKLTPHYATIVFYGKKKESNDYSLQLNDKYVRFDDFIEYISPHHLRDNYTPELSLYCDKDASTKDLEAIFLYMQMVNMLKISLVNKIDYSIGSEVYPGNDLQYSHQILKFKLSPYANNTYLLESLKKSIPPPSPPLSSIEPTINQIQYFFLIKDEFYSGKEKVSKEELITKCKTLILNKELGVFLFDLESSYSKFIEFMMCYHGTLNKLRNDESIKLYDTPFEFIKTKNQILLVEKFPDISINGLSIEHYRALEEDNDYESKLKDVDLNIPDFYFNNKGI